MSEVQFQIHYGSDTQSCQTASSHPMVAVGEVCSYLPMQRSFTIACEGDTPWMGCELFWKRKRKDLSKPDMF